LNKKNRTENGSKLEALDGWFAKDISNFIKILAKLKFLNEDETNQSETFQKKLVLQGYPMNLKSSRYLLK
jgi:hypothetical protein